jgi:hypothetical protein
MPHAKTPNGRAVVVANFVLYGIESYTLADYGVRLTLRAPYSEWHLEAHSLGAVLP